MLHQGRKLSYFGGCDYFRLASDRRVLQALRDGLRRYGLNVAASRTTTGNHPLYAQIENEVADFFDVPAATLAPTGWAPALMAAEALAGGFSHAVIDERAHPCLQDAAILLGCPVVKFQHRDAADLARVIKRLGQIRPLLLTDGVFSHYGAVAPVREYLKILPRGGMMLVDDAHGAGVLGRHGRGTLEHAGIDSGPIVRTITLSKAFGVFGGAVLGQKRLKDAIMRLSGVFIGSTPLPLPLAAAARESIRILRQGGRLRGRLRRNASRVREGLRAGGLDIADNPGPIIAVVPPNQRATRRLTRELLAARIIPTFINYPGGPKTGYFRFAISSEHSPKQLDRLISAILRAN